MNTPLKSTICFDEFAVDPNRRVLLKSGEIVNLNPKTFDLLLAFVERQGEVVGKDELLDIVWEGQFVEEGNLTVNISLLRKALGEKINEPRFLVTVPGKGYKFIAPVSFVENESQTVLEDNQKAGVSPVTRDSGGKPPVSALGNWSLPPYILGAISLVAGIVVVLFVIVYFTDWRNSFWDSETPKPIIEASQQRLISTFPGSHSQPSFSPDGNKVAFVQASGSGSQIWVKDLNGGNPVQLTTDIENAERPRWSPVGNEIVFNCRSGGNSDICLVPVNGGESRKIINEGRNPSWGWDGERLVFERGYEIWTANNDGTNQRLVEGVPPADLLLADRLPAFSPDGSLIAFFQNEKGPMGDYWIIPAEGGNVKRLTFDLTSGGAVRWLPDGTNIIFPTRRGGSLTLWSVSVAGGQPAPVLKSAGEDTEPDISRDGKKLIYTNTRKSFVLTVTDIRTGESRDLRESGLEIINPSFSPDGQKIVFFGFDNSGDLHIYKIDVSGENLAQVTGGKDEKNIQPQWSADGQTIYFYQMHPTHTFRKIPAGGGESAEIAPDWFWERNNEAHISPDETKVVYTKLEKGKSAATYIRDIADGKETEFSLPLRHPRFSHDGKFIVGTLIAGGKQAKNEIIICPVDGGQCRGIANGIHPRWSADDSKIFYYGPNEQDSYPVWVVSIYGGDEKKAAELRPMSPINMFFNVSPQEEIVWIKLDQRKSELWLADLSFQK